MIEYIIAIGHKDIDKDLTWFVLYIHFHSNLPHYELTYNWSSIVEKENVLKTLIANLER